MKKKCKSLLLANYSSAEKQMKAVCILRRAVAQQKLSVGRESAGDLRKSPQIHVTEKPKTAPVPSQSEADLGHSAPPPPRISDK